MNWKRILFFLFFFTITTTTTTITIRGTTTTITTDTQKPLIIHLQDQDNSNAQENHHQQQCNEQNKCSSKLLICQNHTCMHKDLLPFETMDYIGALAVFLACLLASGTGTGGGGLLVPLYVLVLGLIPHEAIPLSKATIFGGAVANFLNNYSRRHPKHRNKLLIDYDVVMILEPMTLAGTIIGVYLNKIFPNWLITVLLCAVLFLTCRKTLSKGADTWKKEEEKQEAIMKDIIQYWSLLVASRSPHLHPHHHHHQENYLAKKYVAKWRKAAAAARNAKLYQKKKKKSLPPSKSSTKGEFDTRQMNLDMTVRSNEVGVYTLLEMEEDYQDTKEQSFLLPKQAYPFFSQQTSSSEEDFLEQESKLPKSTLLVLTLVWLGVIGVSLLKGGEGAKSIIGLQCGSPEYWIVGILIFPFLFAISYGYALRTIHKHETMQKRGYQFCEGDFIWDKSSAIKYPFLCMLVGVAAGLLGIGGGMIKGPLMLDMGYLPEVVTVTSSFMILFTSSSTTAQFMIFGMIRYDYALWFASVGCCGTVCGKHVLDYLINKYNTRAVIIYLIASVIGISGIAMVALGISDFTIHGMEGIKSICS